MKLHIENLAKIGVADINLDGITVIVGDNNTGKSTIGKALWAMFSAFSNLEEKAKNERYENCYRVLRQPPLKVLWLESNMFSPKDIVNKLISKEISVEKTLDELNRILEPKKIPKPSLSELNYIQERLHEILDISDKDLQAQIVLNIFNWIFNRQITSYYHPRKKTFIKMTIKDMELSVNFNKNLPTIVNKLSLQNNPYFFDDPYQIEQLDYTYFSYISSGTFSSSKYINLEQLRRITDSFIHRSSQEISAVETILLHKKFNSINKLFSNTMDGQLQCDPKDGFQYISTRFKQPLQLKNLSQGIKSLALLQAAFSHGAIQDRDVLILDEPEIHLHPDWQIKYAELVVLLQKTFNLTVLLTTHSPDFAQAIRLYSQKHGLSGKLNAYISKEQEDGTVTMDQVPQDDWDEVFEKFAKSFDKLMALRSDLENPESDSASPEDSDSDL